MSSTNTSPRILTVSQITFQIRNCLESQFTEVVVEGELSGWSVAPSGHAYFSLKDDAALISGVMWRNARQRLGFDPGDGMKVECRGKITLFEKRGQYQLLVESMRRSGEGELWARFQALKAKLEKEGLFAADRKRAMPRLPCCIGVVTSPTGAAIRDILQILGRRAPALPVLIAPARVQGNGAAREIAAGVERLARSGSVDVVIVGRGGGSAEDLWEFNDEHLARVIHRCPVPVVSAVGHEIDFSISDFVADLRAPTPSAAAEILSAGWYSLRDEVRENLRHIHRHVTGELRERRQRIRGLVNSRALHEPETRLRNLEQRIDIAMRRLPQTINRRMDRLRATVERLGSGLEGHNPELILQKGYAIIRRPRDNQVISSADRLKKNAQVDIQLRDGTRRATITDDGAADLFG